MEVVSFLHSYDFQSADAAALDVGCGSGVHSNLMVQFGFKVVHLMPASMLSIMPEKNIL